MPVTARVQYDLDVGQAGTDSRENPVNSLSTPSKFVSPKVTVTWRPQTDWMIYGTFSSGFRPGIVNTGLATRIAELDTVRAGNSTAEQRYQDLVDLQTVDGDSVVNYELGTRRRWPTGERASSVPCTKSTGRTPSSA